MMPKCRIPESYEQWLDNGSHDAMWRANARMKEMLANYEAPPIDQAVDDELEGFYRAAQGIDGRCVVLIKI